METLLLLTFSLLLSAPQAPAVRFHHFHYRVGDPGAAMNRAATTFKGTRVIVPGIGVGVRVGSEYVLFEREESDEPAARLTSAAAYADAVRWLREQGIAVSPDTLSSHPVARIESGLRLDHLAFAADDLDGVAGVLARRGITPQSRTADRLLFALPSGARIEIVRSTDAPDAFWCPMHPGVRSAGAAKCPLCGMDLTPIPPPRVGEYKMDVAVGRGRLRLLVRDPDGGQPVEHFADVHERVFHLFIVSRDLTYFAHEHPQRAQDGAFELPHRLPPGEYMLIADFLPQGGTPQMLQRAIVTPGYAGPPGAAPALRDDAAEKEVNGLRVRLDPADLLARRRSSLRVTVTDAPTGKPVEDLQPYLGAAGHMLVVNAELTEAIHAHPEEPFTKGPSITFAPVLPAAGKYKLWVQVQRNGKIVTVPFVITVDP